MAQPPSSSSGSQRTVSFRERLGHLVSNNYQLTASQVQAVVEQAVSGVRHIVGTRNIDGNTTSNHGSSTTNGVSERNVDISDRRDVGTYNVNHDIRGPSHAVPRESYRAHDVPPPRANYPASSSDEENVPHLPDTKQTGGGVKRKSKTQTKNGKKRKPGENIQDESEVPNDKSPSKNGKCKTKTKHIDSQYSYDTSTQNDESNVGTFSDNTANYDSSEDDLFQDVPTSPPSTPTWTFVDQRISRRFGVREVWYDFRGELQGATSIKYVLAYLQTALEELQTLILNGTEERDYVRLVLVSDQLNVPIAFPWAMVRDFDISYILERIKQILNSNRHFLLNPGFTIRFHHVVNPAGGRARKFDGVPAALAAVPSNDDDELCFARAVLIAIRHAQNDPIYKTWSRNDRRASKTLRNKSNKNVRRCRCRGRAR